MFKCLKTPLNTFFANNVLVTKTSNNELRIVNSSLSININLWKNSINFLLFYQIKSIVVESIPHFLHFELTIGISIKEIKSLHILFFLCSCLRFVYIPSHDSFLNRIVLGVLSEHSESIFYFNLLSSINNKIVMRVSIVCCNAVLWNWAK